MGLPLVWLQGAAAVEMVTLLQEAETFCKAIITATYTSYAWDTGKQENQWEMCAVVSSKPTEGKFMLTLLEEDC